MYKKGILPAALLLVVAAAVFFFIHRPADSVSENSQPNGITQTGAKKRETTIRNVTEETVYYTVKTLGGRERTEERGLKVGKIDRFSGDYDLDVTFFKDGEYITYTLDAGTPYSFRYDENDLLELYEGSHGREDAEDLAPFVPTPMVVVERMLELARVNRNTLLYDLGCGDGRIVIQAAKKYGARGVGVDIDPIRIEESNANAQEAGIEHLVEFRLGDVMKIDFSEATVVTMYLLPESNEVLRPLLEKQLKKGAFVVSHNYYVPGWSGKELTVDTVVDDDGEEHDIYLYLR
ncbi:MAG: methyltransferase domain-containing protein [Candidatus Aminicenantes bacterium]|jgi:SAM-dependent methyltransferase